MGAAGGEVFAADGDLDGRGRSERHDAAETMSAGSKEKRTFGNSAASRARSFSRSAAMGGEPGLSWICSVASSGPLFH
jgi:hypothetical protein